MEFKRSWSSNLMYSYNTLLDVVVDRMMVFLCRELSVIFHTPHTTVYTVRHP